MSQTLTPHHPTESSQPSKLAEPSDLLFDYPPPAPFIPNQAPTEFGIQIDGCDKDIFSALAIAKEMGLTWIKQQARWGDIETAPERFDWACLDHVIPAVQAQGFKLLLSVTTAPAHSRQIYKGVFHEVNGRPADLREFGLFIARLIERYPGQIQAIEMWNEPNLIREWGDVLDGGAYAQLLSIGYGVVKSLDPSIMVISAGMAPTGFNSKWTNVDDRSFLAQMAELQAGDYFDCLGAHANGPDGSGDIDHVATTYFDLFARSKPICVTEFGYAIPISGHAPEGFEWIMTAAHTEQRQREVLVNGLRWAHTSGYARLVILWSLNYDGNFNGMQDFNDANAPYALTRNGWTSLVIPAIAELLRK